MSIVRRSLMNTKGSKEPPNYLRFTALEDGTFTLSIPATLSVSNYKWVEYSIDEGSTWVHTDNADSTAFSVTTPTILEGDSVLWRGSGVRMNNITQSVNDSCNFTSTCRFDVSGLIMSLINRSRVKESDTLHSYSFPFLFYNNTNIVNAKDIILPSNAEGRCYYKMFQGCTSLISAPVLPALSLSGKTRCYEGLFSGCTNDGFNYIKMLATNIGGTTTYTLRAWVYQVKYVSTSVFVKHINATWTTTGQGGVPSNWKIIYYDPTDDKYYTSQDKSQECDDHGNPI